MALGGLVKAIKDKLGPAKAAEAPDVARLRGEFAAIKRDLVAFFGNTLRPSDEVLISHAPGGFRPYRVFRTVKRDGRVHSALQKRRLAVLARNWDVAPADKSAEAKRAAEFVRWALTRLRFDKLTAQMLDSVAMGFAVVELIWDGVRDDSGALRQIPVKTKKREQDRFTFTVDEEPRLLTPESPLDGVPLPERKFVITRAGEDATDDPYGFGLCSLLFWPVLFKRQNVTFWSIFNDKFGSPTAYSKYAAGASDEEKTAVLELLRNLANDSAIVLPDGWEIGLLEKGAGAGAGDSFEKFLRFCGDEISEIVNGETLTTNIGQGGSRAAAQVHDGVRLEVAKADADLQCEVVNETVVRWLIELNMPGAPVPTVSRDFKEAVDLEKMAKVDDVMKRLGWERSEESVTEVYGDGFKRAAPPEPVEPGKPGAKPDPAKDAANGGDGDKPAQFAELADALLDRLERRRRGPAKPADRATPEALADRLAIEAAAETDAMIARAKALVETAGTLEEFRDALPALFAEMDVRELGTTIERAIDAAKLHGWFEARTGGGDG